MPERKFLTVLFVAANICVPLAVVVAYSAHSHDAPRTVITVLAFSQVSLLSMWVVLGKIPFIVRLVLAGIGVAFWSGSLEGLTDLPWAIPLLAAATFQVAALFWLQRKRVRLVQATAEGDERRGEPDGPWQFSISQILIWTTVVAIILAVLKITGLSSYSTEFLLLGVVIGVVLSIVAHAALWSVLGKLPWAVRVVLLLATPQVGGFFFGEIEVAYLLANGVALLTACCLVVVRQCGYRLVRSGS